MRTEKTGEKKERGPETSRLTASADKVDDQNPYTDDSQQQS